MDRSIKRKFRDDPKILNTNKYDHDRTYYFKRSKLLKIIKKVLKKRSRSHFQTRQEQHGYKRQYIGQTFQTTAHLANLIPTGTVYAFQLLSPIFSNGGQCDLASKIMTLTILVGICRLSCFILSFTDSYKDKKRYNLLRISNIAWVLDH
ncbi:hypothetical protein YC2023_031501 [Brassica napus]